VRMGLERRDRRVWRVRDEENVPAMVTPLPA
jgi:hypothetical protein